MASERLRFGKEKVEFKPNIKMVEEIVSDVVDRANSEDYPQLRKDLIFWEGGHIDPENIFVKSHDSVVDVLIGTPSANKKVFSIGLGENSLYFDNRNFPDSMIFRTKPYGELKNEDHVGLAIYGFIQKRPADTEFIDISRKTLEEKMKQGKEAPQVKVSSIEDFKKEAKVPKRKMFLHIW